MSGELSFDQAVSNMYKRIETGGVIAFRNPTMPILRSAAPPAAYVLITHQFQGGGNVRFSMIVKIPGMSQTGADVSGVEKLMALAGQSAMEAAYQKNSYEDNVAAAKAEGLRAIKRFISGKGAPVETAGGGFILGQPMNFVALSGKIIQLPKGAIVHSYCVAPELNNGYLIGFTIGQDEWVVGGNEFSMNRSSSGYQLRGGKEVFYTNKVQLNPGKLPISFVHRVPTGPKEKIVQLFTEEKDISSDRIEPLNGTFSSSTRLSDLGYDSSKQPVGETTVDKDVCGKHKDIVQMANRMGGDIEIVIQKGKSDESLRYLLDSEGNESIPIKKDDPVKAKGRITYVEESGKITGANAQLNRDKIRPGRNDYKPNDPLKASENVINTAIKNAFQRANGSGIHEGWNEAAIGTKGRFHCETMPVTGIAVVIIEVGISIYESSALPEQVWNEPPGTTAEKGSYPIHGPPVVCGVADGVIEEVTEIPQLVKMGVELASSPEAVKGLVASIADITPAKIVELAEGEIKKKWDNYTGPPQVMFHTGGKDAVAVATVLLAVGTIVEVASEFKDAIQETGEAISRGLDNLLSALHSKLDSKELFPRLQDALNDPALRELFTSNPDLVKIWELAIKSGFQESWVQDPDFIRKLRNVWDYNFVNGSNEKLPNIVLEPTLLTKVSQDVLQQLRNTFKSSVKPNFLKSLGNNSSITSMLKKAGLSDSEIPALVQRLQRGEGIPGYQVHHKIPLDLGGTNDFSNLVLMKQTPYHSAVTSFHNSQINIPEGQTQTLNFPKVNGSFYSPPYIE